jgi:predicted histidine transporter YuiF (NhaC family)
MQEKRNLELKLQIEADKNSAKMKKEAKQVKTKAGSSTVKPIAKSSATEDIGYMLGLLYVVMSFDKEIRKVKYKNKDTQKQSQFDVYTAFLANPHHNGVSWTIAGRESEGHCTWVK